MKIGTIILLSFWDADTYEDADVSEDYVGRWTERQLADGSFEIQITGLTPPSESTTNVDCVIAYNNTMILRIPAGEMAHYRVGEVVTGSFDSSPLTHIAKAGCHITTVGQHIASPTSLLIRQDDGLK
ncbi:MAG: hypothetical protein MR890_02545 [Akkermansia muciniphila]|nr:hypothetical protein [Akkermansia muciniphila]